MKISPYAIENIAPYIVGAKTGREIIKFLVTMEYEIFMMIKGYLISANQMVKGHLKQNM